MSIASAQASEANDRQPLQSKASKAASRKKGDAAEKHEKGSWYVSPRGRQKLAIHALMSGKSQSEYLDSLLCGLNHYSMPGVLTRSSKGSLPNCDTVEDRQEGSAA